MIQKGINLKRGRIQLQNQGVDLLVRNLMTKNQKSLRENLEDHLVLNTN